MEAPTGPHGSIVIVGSPTALGGHFAGMERTPAELRRRGLAARLAARPGLAGAVWHDLGDVPNDPGWAADPDTRAKNRTPIGAYLPRLAAHAESALRGTDNDARPLEGRVPPDDDTRLLILGGDCTSNAGALAGIRRARPGIRLGLAWFDAHGDFNTPDTTPSGNVWGMPFAMACGRGDPDLVGAVDGPTVREADAGLFGAQVLDETESRMLAASPIAVFGAGMLADPAGQAAVAAWSTTVAERIDAWYIAFDLDALDAGGGWAVAMPEPGGMTLERARAMVRTIATSGAPVIGFGATAVLFGGSDQETERGAEATVDAVATLAEAALGR